MGKRRIPTYNVNPTLTHPSRWRSPMSSRDRLYQSSRRHPHTLFSQSFFKKQIFQNFLGPFREPPGLDATSSNTPPRATYPRIFSRLSSPIYARREAVEPNLQLHPYATNQPSSSRKVTGLLYAPHLLTLSRFNNGTTIQIIFGPFSLDPGAQDPIVGFPSSRYITYDFFPHLHLIFN